ncbi:hypothetical protein TWF506_008369 [Arthrobotrys conoides]|uniref:Uncharacterized protein n=1 Tax=Arthrobotrys conoides TaxID=74498 RepID=A0AAN8NVT5_9PEZI
MTALFDTTCVSASTISKQKHHIAGIEVTIYGASEVAQSATSVVCLFLLHPRLETLAYVEPIALRCLQAHHESSSQPERGLIVASFDQRNHGARLVSTKANEAWRSGNELHAIDMFGIYQGTSHDVSLLIDHIPSYVFPDGNKTVDGWLCAGVSLGGHATWLSLVNEPRVKGGVVIIGCPDFQSVMTHRAWKSKLKSYQEDRFIGSPDYPKTLDSTVRRTDPVGIIMRDRSQTESSRLIKERLGGKKILSLSGAADKLVPYDCSKPFLDLLKAEGQGLIDIKDIAYDGIGHDCTEQMIVELVTFVTDFLSAGTESKSKGDYLGINYRSQKMSSDLGSEGSQSPDWVFINSPDYHSPGHNLLTSPALAIMPPSLSNRDFSMHTISTSPSAWIECSTPSSPVSTEPTKQPDLLVNFFGKIEFFCENCVAPPARCTRNTIRTNLMSNTTKFTLLGPGDQVDGFMDRRGRRKAQVSLFNTVGIETPSTEDMLRIRLTISTLNSNPRITAYTMGYEALDEVPYVAGHRWSIVEPFLRRHTSCKNCFIVFVKYEFSRA